MSLFTEQKETHRFRKTTYGYQGRGRWEEGIESLGWECTQCYI